MVSEVAPFIRAIIPNLGMTLHRLGEVVGGPR
ncbi:hypothetical protein DFR28_1021120 [Arenicella xantha]|uniref:Uncharacterized protein n=1 Tax=Arenicella xantha TaxID=644221 RepID=A0A395JQ38_9GAMM|nr:hypothetical protein DFR28_1021120 [Arenicella xantha]